MSLAPEGSRAASRRPGELCDLSGRRIILVASDCTADPWRDGRARDLLEAWGRTQPLAIVQVLPPSPWLQTGLGRSPEVLVFAPRVGAPNALLAEAEGSHDDSPLPIPLPAIRLEPAPLAAWARMLTSPGAAGAPALLFEPAPLAKATATAVAPSGEDRVRRFESFASQPAQDLAACLASVPLKPALLRMVQRTIVPGAREAHLAEVLLGGLTRVVTGPDRDPDPDALSLDFLPGVRDALFSRLTTVRAMSVFHAVSRYIADHFGESIDFLALLENPDGFVPVGSPGQDRPFARIASQFLRRLGGRYARAADRLDLQGETWNTLHQANISYSEGFAAALARIAEAKEKRTGFLDLGRLGLTELPKEMFELEHLTGLNLGSWWFDEQQEQHEAASNLAPNQFADPLTRFPPFPRLRLLSLTQTDFRDLSPLVGLAGLQSLDCSDTPVGDLGPLAGLSHLQSLGCSRTQVSDLGPLAGLAGLQSLDCSDTPVGDLGPLAGLSHLQSLGCSRTQVSDLGPLAGLAGLQSLGCSRTQVSDLGPLAGLAGLQSLDCSDTPVGDLGPLAGLSHLQSLGCSRTQISDLGPLAGLAGLQSLDCYVTQVSDLGPLAGLSTLQSLNCSETQVSDLGPLAGLSALQSLACWRTQVSDLGPLAGLSAAIARLLRDPGERSGPAGGLERAAIARLLRDPRERSGPAGGLERTAIARLLRDPRERSAGAFSLARITQKAHSFQHPHYRHSHGGLIPRRLHGLPGKPPGTLA